MEGNSGTSSGPNAVPYASQILRRDYRQWNAPHARPPAWAPSRSDLAAVTPWFKSYQGGVYTIDEIFKGILVGRYNAFRSYLDAEIVITGINGTESAIGEVERPGSTQTASRVRAFRTAIKTRSPIGLIVQKDAANGVPEGLEPRDYEPRKPLFPLRFPDGEESWVVDWFVAVDIWPEPRAKLDPESSDDPEGIEWMVKMQKYDIGTPSFWADIGAFPPALAMRDVTSRAEQLPCERCGISSPKMFIESWLCRNEKCEAFWRKNDNKMPRWDELTYTNEYLMERQTQDHLPHGSAAPRFYHDFVQWYQAQYENMRQVDVDATNFFQRSKDLLQGFCCPWCLMLNRRFEWTRWRCRNPQCHYEVDGRPPRLKLEYVKLFGAVALGDFTKLPYYVRSSQNTRFTIYDFQLLDECYVSYMMPMPNTTAMSGGADQMYESILQLANEGTLGLERRYTKSAADATMTDHFSANFGRHYEFAAATPTISLEEAPPEISHSVDTANEICDKYFGEGDGKFNEMYLAAYWSDMGMSWHDDGEWGLGPVIGTYTLGGQGVMKFGIKTNLSAGKRGRQQKKKKEEKGPDSASEAGEVPEKSSRKRKTPGPKEAASSKAKTKFLEADPVPPGCQREAERRALKQRLASGELSQAEWQKAFEDLMKSVKKRTKPQSILELPLVHGSYVVMHGKNMQRYYEHIIEVNSPFRFALTFRHISDKHATAKAPPKRGRRTKVAPVARELYDGQHYDSTDAEPDGTEEPELPDPKRQRTGQSFNRENEMQEQPVQEIGKESTRQSGGLKSGRGRGSSSGGPRRKTPVRPK